MLILLAEVANLIDSHKLSDHILVKALQLHLSSKSLLAIRVIATIQT